VRCCWRDRRSILYRAEGNLRADTDAQACLPRTMLSLFAKGQLPCDGDWIAEKAFRNVLTGDRTRGAYAILG